MNLRGDDPNLEIIEYGKHIFGPQYDLYPLPLTVLPTIREHAKEHGYFLEVQHGVEIAETSSFSSWMEYVFAPTMYAIKRFKLVKKLKKHPLELFIAVSDHWHYLKQQVPREEREIYIDEAAKSYLKIAN